MRTLVPPPGGDNTSTLDGLLSQAARLRTAGADDVALVAKVAGYPGAVAVVAAAKAERFIRRFFTDAVPCCWHAGVVVQLTVHGLDPEDPETAAEVATIARGRWFWATPAGSPALLDAATTPPPRQVVAGAGRAERRRQGAR